MEVIEIVFAPAKDASDRRSLQSLAAKPASSEPGRRFGALFDASSRINRIGKSAIGLLMAAIMYSRFQPPNSEDVWADTPLGRLYHAERLNGNGLHAFEYPLYHATDEELEQFLGSVFKSVARAASNVVSAAGKALRPIGKAVNAITKFVPLDLLTMGLRYTPLGMAAMAGLGAARAVADGKNPFQGAIRTLVNTPIARLGVDTAAGVLQGKNILQSLKEGARGGYSDLRESLRFAATIAPFVPGIGTGVGAALGAANALASGQPITQAIIAAARGAIPGGTIAQAGFETAVNLVKGKPITEALLAGVRSRIPGGPAAQAAFDTGIALAQGQNIQNATLAGAGRLLPPSPYTSDALSFVKKVASGEKLGNAALSTLGNLAMKRVEHRVGPILRRR